MRIVGYVLAVAISIAAIVVGIAGGRNPYSAGILGLGVGCLIASIYPIWRKSSARVELRSTGIFAIFERLAGVDEWSAVSPS